MANPSQPNANPDAPLDCLIVGGGPAGLTAAIYLARFGRRFLLVDEGEPRAAWIPVSHNIPVFADGISGRDFIARQHEHLSRYGAAALSGSVDVLEPMAEGFAATIIPRDGRPAFRAVAKRVILACGAVDVEPALPDLKDAVRRGLVRYCPICDGHEARGRRIGVIGYGDRGLGEAAFIARTYSPDVTLLTLGQAMDIDAREQAQIDASGIKVVHEPIAALELDGDRIAALRTGTGTALRFEVLYSALGRLVRSELGLELGAEHAANLALRVDDHNRTSVPGLYAAGGVVDALDQLVVAMGHAAIAATDVHNRCDQPLADWPAAAGVALAGRR